MIEGAIRAFRLAKPTIAFEHGWHGDQDRARSEPIDRLIREDLGLRLFDMDGNGPLELSEFFEGLKTRWNWVRTGRQLWGRPVQPVLQVIKAVPRLRHLPSRRREWMLS